MEGVNTPFRYEPSGDCDGEQYGTDHFVVDAKGDEIACAPNEATGRLLAAAPDLLESLTQLLKQVDRRCGGRIEGDSPLVDACEVARILIARATGEATA